MELIGNSKRFRYLSGVVKFINEIKKNTKEEDIEFFKIEFKNGYYYLEYKYIW